MQKQSEDEDWALLKPLIFAAIMDHLQSGRPVIKEEATTGEDGQPTYQGPSDTGEGLEFLKYKIFKVKPISTFDSLNFTVSVSLVKSSLEL